MPLGNPIRKQNESRMVSVLATEGQTVFTVQGGYIINHISVFRNGVRLSPAEDFTAGDGSTVTLNNAANIDDRIDFHIFDRFTVQNAIIGAASTQTINGDLVLNGKLFGALDVPSINLTGIVTATELDLNGKGDISSDLTITRHLSVGGISTFSDDISIADKIIHTGDTNTAIRFPTDDTFAVETSGSERFRVTSIGSVLQVGSGSVGSPAVTLSGTAPSNTLVTTSAGKLGINHNSPVTILHAVGNGTVGTSVTMTLQSHDTINATAGIELLARDSSNNNEICKIQAASGGATSVSLEFHTDDSEKMRIDSSGRVLIGTTTEGQEDADNLTIADSGSCGITIRSGTSAAGSLYFSDATSGTAEYDGAILYNHSSKFMAFYANESERMRITTGGLVGINTSIPASFLDVVNHGGAAEIMCQSSTQPRLMLKTTGTTAECRVDFGDSGDSSRGAIGYNHNDDALKFYTTGVANERMRITSSGEVLIGHTAAFGHSGIDGHLQVTGTGTDDTSITQTRFSNDQWCPFISMAKSRNATIGSHTVVQNNDYLGYINFAGSDGTDFNNGAAFIAALVDGTPGTDDMPGRLIFATSADNANSPTERMRIDNQGRVMIGNDQGSTQYADGGDDLVIGKTSGAHGITIISQNNNVGRLMFSDTYTSGTGTYEGQILYSHASNTMNFYANYTSNQNIAMTIGGSNGDVTVQGGNLIIGTSGKGIDFSATGQASGMTNELLDDYEEGSWTPSFTQGVSGGSYTTQSGHYTRVGRLVMISARIDGNGLSANGDNLLLGGLPFTTVASGGTAGGLYFAYSDNFYSGSSGTNLALTIIVNNNATVCEFFDGDGTQKVGTDFYDVNRNIHIVGTYHAA